MKHYELTYLLSSDLSEEELETLTKEINNFIPEKGGTLDKKEEPVRGKLGYPIKKRGEAYLITLSFSSEPQNLKELEKKLKAEDRILRYVILARKPIPKITKKEVRPRVMAGVVAKEEEKKIKRPLKPKKVELKEIDKKIEEILKE